MRSVIADPGPRILGVAGSPRRGNSDAVLAAILEGAGRAGVETRGVRLADLDFGSCIACERCRKDRSCTGLDDGLTPLYPDIISSGGLVVVSPTYNYNITSWMKAFIDRLYCFYVFTNDRPRRWSSLLAGQGRKAVVAAICEQEDPKDMGFTVEAMRLPLEALGYEVVGELRVLEVFDAGRVRERSGDMERAGELGAELARAVAGLGPGNP